MKSKLRIAVAVATATLAAPALASDSAEPSSLASDPNQPEVKNPAPAVALRGSGRAEAAALSSDPNQPPIESAAPAMAVPSLSDEALAGGIVNDEPLASAVRQEAASSRVARR